MKWWYALLVAALVIPVVQATEINPRITSNSFLSAIHAVYDNGTCQYNIDSVRNNPARWPSAAACAANVGRSFTYGAGSLHIDNTQGNFDAASRLVWQSYDYDKDGRFGRDDHHYDRFIFGTASTADFNNYLLEQLPGDIPGFPVLTLGWCGEELELIFAKNNLVPTHAKYTSDADGECRRTFAQSSGSHGYDGMNGFIGLGNTVARPFTFPLQQECSAYAVKVVDTMDNDWSSMEGFQILTESSGGVFSYSRAQSSNTLNIDIHTTGERNLTSISIRSRDSSGDNGGVRFTVYCVQPEPDSIEASCTAPWAWSETVHQTNPGNACCGNSPTDVGQIFGDQQCTQTITTFAWQRASDICSYPEGWEVDGSEERAREDAPNTFVSGVPIEQACCSDPRNHGRIHTDDNNQVLCAVNATGAARWMRTDAEAYVAQITSHDTRTLASNGTNWLSCNAPTLQPFTITVNGTAPRDAGACANSPSICNQNYESCMSDCEPGDTVCQGWCSLANSSCQCPLLTACSAGNRCMCSDGFEWNGTWCVTHSNQPSNFTYTPPSFQAAQICNIVNNGLPQAASYICHFNWTQHNPDSRYYVNNSSQPVNGSQIGEITGVCRDGNPVPATQRFNATRNEVGFCDLDQCFYGVVENREVCVPTDSWLYNNYCLQQEPGADWETRTRFLADALYNTTDNGPFILHCDESEEALNRYAQITPYEENAFVSGFCVLSKGEEIAVGVTLNPLDGNISGLQPAISAFEVNVPPFIRLLNNTEFGNQTNPCANTLASNSYTECTGFVNASGRVYYNNLYGTLVFTKESFTPQGSFLSSVRSWWNGLVNGETELLMPLGGHKMYFAKGDEGRSIQGRVYYKEPDGVQEAKIVAVNMPEIYTLCTRQSNATHNCTQSGDISIVTIQQPTQPEWELFTLRIRP